MERPGTQHYKYKKCEAEGCYAMITMTGGRKYCKKCKKILDGIAAKTFRTKQKEREKIKKMEALPEEKPEKGYPKTEKETFEVVRNKRKHICEVCMKPIPEALALCFAHVLGKGMDPKYRCNPNNIVLVCSEKHHREVDRLAGGLKHILRGILASGRRLDVKTLRFYNGL